MMSVFFAFDV